MQIRVPAEQLQPGDKLSFGREIVRVILQGVRLPTHKCLVTIKNVRRGDVVSSHWNKKTLIVAERDE